MVHEVLVGQKLFGQVGAHAGDSLGTIERHVEGAHCERGVHLRVLRDDLLRVPDLLGYQLHARGVDPGADILGEDHESKISVYLKQP